MLSSLAVDHRNYHAPNLVWAERALRAFRHQIPIAGHLESEVTESESNGFVRLLADKLILLLLYPLYLPIKWTLPFWIRKVESAVVETRGYLEYIPLFEIEHAKSELKTIRRMSKMLRKLSSEEWLALLNDESISANVRRLFANCFEMRTNIEEAIRLLNLVILQGSPAMLDADLSEEDAEMLHAIIQKRMALLNTQLPTHEEDAAWLEANLAPVLD